MTPIKCFALVALTALALFLSAASAQMETWGCPTKEELDEQFVTNTTRIAKAMGFNVRKHFHPSSEAFSYEDLVMFMLTIGYSEADLPTAVEAVVKYFNNPRITKDYEAKKHLPWKEHYSPFWVVHNDTDLQTLQDVAFTRDKVALVHYLEGHGKTAWLWKQRDWKVLHNFELEKSFEHIVKHFEQDIIKARNRADNPSSVSEKHLRKIIFDYQTQDGHGQCQGTMQEYGKWHSSAQRRSPEYIEKHDNGYDEHPHLIHRPPKPEPSEEENKEKWANKKLRHLNITASRHTHDDNRAYYDTMRDALQMALNNLPRRYHVVLIHPETMHLMPVSEMLDTRFMRVTLIDPDHKRFLPTFNMHSVLEAHPEINPYKVMLRPNLYRHDMSYGPDPKWLDEDVTRTICLYSHIFLKTAKSVNGNIREFFYRLKQLLKNFELIPSNMQQRIMGVQDADLVIAHDVAGSIASGLLEMSWEVFHDSFVRNGDYSHLPEEFDTEEKFRALLEEDIAELKKVMADRFVRSMVAEIPKGGILVLSYPVSHCYDILWENATWGYNLGCEKDDSSMEDAVHKYVLPHLPPEHRTHWRDNYEGHLNDHPFVISQYTTELRSEGHPKWHYGQVKKRLEAEGYENHEGIGDDEVIQVTKVKVLVVQWGEPRDPNPQDVPYVGDDYHQPTDHDNEPADETYWRIMHPNAPVPEKSHHEKEEERTAQEAEDAEGEEPDEEEMQSDEEQHRKVAAEDAALAKKRREQDEEAGEPLWEDPDEEL